MRLFTCHLGDTLKLSKFQKAVTALKVIEICWKAGRVIYFSVAISIPKDIYD